MGRAPCCDERVALKKGPWTPDEDHKLVAYIQKHGHGSWRHLPEKAGLARCGKSCRLRWTNYLRPDIKRGRFSNEEDQLIIQLHAILGNRWSAIASHLPRRTDNEIKNYWNTHLRKRLAQLGIDPVTHKALAAAAAAPPGLALAPAWTPLVSTQLTHSSQWHCALAEAEARLTKSTPDLQTISTAPPHPSAYFMRSWKTKVEDTLRPTFGSISLEPQRETPTSSRAPKPVQDWNTALGFTSPSAMAVKLDQTPALKPDNLLVDMLSESVSEREESQTAFEFATSDLGAHHHHHHHHHLHVGLENHFSPTSILQGPDSSDSCSDNSSFEFLHDHGYHSFPLIDEHDQTEINDDIPEAFWQAGQHAERLLDELKSIGFDITSTQPEFDPQF